jgi:ABC-type antimicrobial peptide transport system permease subunit
MTALGLLGMVLAVIGLYGVISYLTALRTREIGVRMAIGADRLGVLWLVIRQSAGMVGVGLAAGIGLALLFTPALAAPFGLKPRDGMVMTIVPLALAAAAFAASLIPAHRATRISPMTALRDE